MTDREKKYLYDILNSLRHIISFTETITSFNEYHQNFLVKAAVERHLAIIGEAINKFTKEREGNTLNEAAKIISLRNRLVHAYDSIDDRTIWQILRNNVLPLQKEVSKLIESSYD